MKVSRADIIKFVEQHLGFTPTAETKFWSGTGTAGLDVIAFWNEFADHYGVDLEGGDKSYDCGDGEGGLGEAMDHLWKRLTLCSVHKRHHFTIDHLLEVANRKKWFDPE